MRLALLLALASGCHRDLPLETGDTGCAPALLQCTDADRDGRGDECLDRILPLGEGHLRAALKDFVEHYHRERHHQGLGNQLIEPDPEAAVHAGSVRCREQLGGTLKFYYRAAA